MPPGQFIGLIAKSDSSILDEYVTNFGIREFVFDADKGFILNGNKIKINGVCNHHDLGFLGAAINIRAIERQLELMKEMGVNGIRTSHNPPAPELLDLCDKMGFIVMDEAFDIWKKKKTEFDYALDWDEWHKRDLEDLVLRDRNHPSVLTPYLWCYSNHYSSGKYVADGRWSDTAISKQAGAAVLLRRLVELNLITFAKDTTSSKPLIFYSTKKIPYAEELQKYLNQMPGIYLKVDGVPGAKTSDAFKLLSGSYLKGDPRIS